MDAGKAPPPARFRPAGDLAGERSPVAVLRPAVRCPILLRLPLTRPARSLPSRVGLCFVKDSDNVIWHMSERSSMLQNFYENQ
jgi:hypothetical protein